MGIPREDAAGRRAAVLRNYEFFGAPVVAIVCMDKALGLADSMGVGMYLQTLMLALTERGLSSCVEVSVAGYPEIVRRELGIGEEMEVLCGVAIGYEDLEFKGNGLRIGREDIDVTTKWLDE
jgi:nitroreductase